jgi:hypothetical protein
MFQKRFLSSFMGGIFALTLLLNCTAKSTPKVANTKKRSIEDTSSTPDTAFPTEFQFIEDITSTTNRAALPAKLQSMDDAVSIVDAALNKSELEKTVIADLKKTVHSKPANGFKPEELQLFVNTVIDQYESSIPQAAQTSLRSVLGFLSKELSSYKVSGFAFACDPNLGLIWNTQNPNFTAVFKDNEGNVKIRNYDASIESVGLKYALSYNLNFIFFTGDLNFENSNKILELGTGIDVSLTTLFPPLMALPVSVFTLYAPFTNAPGGIFMVGIPLGFTGGLSLVTGGTLIPRS